MRIKDVGEIKLIKRLARGFRLDKTVIEGSGDDTAVIVWTKDKYLLFTCDMLVEGVHFLKNFTKRCQAPFATPFQIGWKALARNISDIAAMGGIPRYAVVSVGINKNLPVSLIEGMCKGLKAAADRFKVNIVGGDMSDSRQLVIDVSLIGEVERKNLATRAGARPGDIIFVTGAMGGSIKGKHLRFVPRQHEARQLVKNFKINSMIDVSDGLALDLWRLLKASKVGARVYRDAIPVSKEASSFSEAIHDGEDFELLFTMSANEAKRFFRTKPAAIKTRVTPIGEIMPKGFGYKLVLEDGRMKELKPEGYRHF